MEVAPTKPAVKCGYWPAISLTSKSKQHVSNLPPITSFSWNPTSPQSIVTCSTDTTATLWDITTSQALTQLIAHDRAVYDLSWLPQSSDIFVSVGADGSLRAFDLRQLEHSTILYETPNSSPLARIAFSNREQYVVQICIANLQTHARMLQYGRPAHLDPRHAQSRTTSSRASRTPSSTRSNRMGIRRQRIRSNRRRVDCQLW